jgi:hypothetical protein
LILSHLQLRTLASDAPGLEAAMSDELHDETERLVEQSEQLKQRAEQSTSEPSSSATHTTRRRCRIRSEW